MHLHWWQWTLLGVGLDILGAMGTSIYYRAQDIYQQKKTKYDEHWMFLLWPLLIAMVPFWVMEQSAQMLAKYMEYKRKKKLNLINKAG